MAPAYKLVYFEGRGAVEGARFILKYGNIEFEDVRVKREDWPQLKEKTPFGTLPYLEKNGKKVDQSHAIMRYLAKQTKLAGKDDWENLEIDAIVDTINDLKNKMLPVHFEQDPEKKKTLLEAALKETFPYYLEKLDATVKKNNGHLATGQLTWADLYFVSGLPSYDKFVGGNTLEKYPNLTALADKVNNIPAIKKWIETRPKTEF